MRIFRAARFLFAMGLRVDAARLLRATVLAVALYLAAPLAALALRDLTDDVLAHRAAPTLAAAVLAGVDANFALDNHLDNAESVMLAPITDGRWSCVRWGALTPPFYPKPDSSSVTEAVASSSDPMG